MLLLCFYTCVGVFGLGRGTCCTLVCYLTSVFCCLWADIERVCVCACTSHRWKNWWVRGILTLAMISFFFFIIYLGPMVLMMIVSDKQQWWGFWVCYEITCFYLFIYLWLYWSETPTGIKYITVYNIHGLKMKMNFSTLMEDVISWNNEILAL